MPTPQKIAIVEDLSERLGKSVLTVLTDYRGLSVTQLQELRSQLREHSAEMRVAKNTLTRIATREKKLDGLHEVLTGPTALVFSYEDPAQPAKVLRDFARNSRILEIKAAVLDGEIISAERVNQLAELPSRDELIADVVGGISAPLYGLVNVMSGPARSLVYALQARVNQLDAAA